MKLTKAIAAAAALLCLAACSRHERFERFASVAPQSAAVWEKVAQASGERQPGDTLAYEHTVVIELNSTVIASRMAELRTSCTLACVVLDVSFQSELGVPSGTIRLRMAPASVDPMITIAAKDGRITSRTTHAEDLAEPVADTERELALLSTHRDRLAEFSNRKGLPVDQLITVSKELASVQTQIDTLNTHKANLHRRIDTEVLTITLSPPRVAYAAEQTPIRDALHSFGSDFNEAVAQVIRFVAGLVPWLVIIVPGLILIRLIWRWTTRWLVRKESRG